MSGITKFRLVAKPLVHDHSQLFKLKCFNAFADDSGKSSNVGYRRQDQLRWKMQSGQKVLNKVLISTVQMKLFSFLPS